MVDVMAAYGSVKDIAVYIDAGIPTDKIFIVNRSRRAALNAAANSGVTWLSDGYAEHLRRLIATSFAPLAPVSQWTALRQWWTRSTEPEHGNALAVPPCLPNPRQMAAERYLQVGKNERHTLIRSHTFQQQQQQQPPPPLN